MRLDEENARAKINRFRNLAMAFVGGRWRWTLSRFPQAVHEAGNAKQLFPKISCSIRVRRSKDIGGGCNSTHFQVLARHKLAKLGHCEASFAAE
jgi:hypothetical protein